ncbi:MAG: type II secretion system F family protein [Candidatus Eremiobacteraeota bacterium]|nr:type II secretion system F family protein [Candidatus Eremiobacteraeota bacterium]MCW5869665.1 type II secretion system F family protein [Candidatus Eremiobacteraeota bacterium]
MSIGSQFHLPSPLPVPLRTRGFRVAGACLLAQIVLGGIGMGADYLGEDYGKLTGYLSPLIALLNLIMWLSFFVTFFYNWLRGRNDAQDQQLILGQLADLLKMGLSLPDALEALSRHQGTNWRSRWSQGRRAFLSLSNECNRGDGLGAAMRRDAYFPPHMASLLEIAEERGLLIEVLENLKLGRSDRPWFTTWFWIRLFCLWLLALPMAVFLCTYIMPTFVVLFEGMSLRLPAVTQFALIVMRWLRSPLGVLLNLLLPLILIATVVACHFHTRFARRVRDILCLLPPFRQVLPLQDQASVAILLAGGLRLGLDEQQTLEVASMGADHPAYRRALSVRPGSIADILNAHPGLFGAPLRWLARQGERHGNLEQALSSAAVYLTERADQAKLRWSIWLEWMMTMAFALVVSLMVVGTYLPIIQATMNLMETSVMP